MRLVTYVGSSNSPRLGVLHDGQVVDPQAVLAVVAQRAGSPVSLDEVPTEMVAFFEGGARARAAAERALQTVDTWLARGDEVGVLDGVTAAQPADAVRLLAPVPRPRRVRDYLTFGGHATGIGFTLPPCFAAFPNCYEANRESIVGPEETLLWPSYTNQLDFELEIGFYTSGGGRNLTPKEAEPLIAGLTIFNDVSARDIQMMEMELVGAAKGKSFCSAMGPCVVTMDEVPDEFAIALEARINGEVWTSTTSKDRYYSCAEVLAWASLDEDVHPGEFMALGTVPGGCGFELDRWIQPGDVIEMEAAGIGILRNVVGQPQPQRPGTGSKGYSGAPEVHAKRK